MTDAFLLAPCTPCGRDALCARDLDEAGALILVCVHCGEAVDAAAAYSVNTEDLGDLGYDLASEHDHPHGERGCRDGQCGVRQPDA